MPPKKERENRKKKVDKPKSKPNGIVSTSEENNTLFFQNSFYKVGFDKKTGAVRAISFVVSGNTLSSPYLSGDSLSDSYGSSYPLRKASSLLTTSAISPAEKELIIRTDYGTGQKCGKRMKAEAIYKYRFSGDTPIIKLNFSLTMPATMKWFGGSFNKFSVFNGFFDKWAVGDPLISGPLRFISQDLKKALDWKSGKSWCALYNDYDALAIISSKRQSDNYINIYDLNKYYIVGGNAHDIVKPNDGVQNVFFELEQYIYVGPGDANCGAVKIWADYLP